MRPRNSETLQDRDASLMLAKPTNMGQPVAAALFEAGASRWRRRLG